MEIGLGGNSEVVKGGKIAMKGIFLCYKGICAFAKYHEEDGIYHGKIEDISDLVTFGGQTLEEVSADFKDAVNDYLDGEVVDTNDVVASLNFATA